MKVLNRLLNSIHRTALMRSRLAARENEVFNSMAYGRAFFPLEKSGLSQDTRTREEIEQIRKSRSH